MNNKFLNKINLFLLFSMLLVAGAVQQTSAAVWTVTKVADTNDNVCNADCSLREAVAAAQDSDEIKFNPNLAGGTIKLTIGTIGISKSITITGINKLSISGGDKYRIFGVGGTANVTMRNLDLGNAYINDQPSPWTGVGGAVYVNNASLEVDNCYIHNSVSHSSGAGIAVIQGVLVVKNSLIAANKALSISGGGIFANSSRVKISNTRFNLNTSVGFGSTGVGGSLALYGGSLEMTDSSIYKSSSEEYGGAIYLYGSPDSVYTIRDSAIHNNSSKTAGGIYNKGKLNLINTTLSGNRATAGSGGALSNYDYAFLRNVTVTLNTASVSAGGIDSASGDVNLGNTIVAGNSNANNASPNLEGSFTSDGYNLIGPGISHVLWGTQTGNQINVADPMLNPLNYNGSATLNHLPKAGSPVIDAGSNALAVDESGNPLLTDQRGLIRIFGNAVDIGAVEVSN